MARVKGFVGVFYAIDEEVPDGTTLEDATHLLEDVYAAGGLLEVIEDHEFTDLEVVPS